MKINTDYKTQNSIIVELSAIGTISV